MRGPGAAAQGTDSAAHTHPHSCPPGLAGTHPCSAALTRSRRSPLCSDKQSSPCSCEFLSRTHRYLSSTPKHHTGVSSALPFSGLHGQLTSRKEIREVLFQQTRVTVGNLSVKCVYSWTSLQDLSGSAANLIQVPTASFTAALATHKYQNICSFLQATVKQFVNIIILYNLIQD